MRVAVRQAEHLPTRQPACFEELAIQDSHTEKQISNTCQIYRFNAEITWTNFKKVKKLLKNLEKFKKLWKKSKTC